MIEKRKAIGRQRNRLHQTIAKSETLHEQAVLDESRLLDRLIMEFYQAAPQQEEIDLEDRSVQNTQKTFKNLPVEPTKKD